MNVPMQSAGKSALLLAAACCVAMLAACTHSAQEAQTRHPGVTASHVPVADWNNCTDPAISAGEPVTGALRLVSGIVLTNTVGSTETSVVLDEPANVSVVWNGDGPTPPRRFDSLIGEAIGYATEGSTGDPTANVPSLDTKALGAFVFYKGIEPVNVPVAISCGAALKATVVVYT